MMGDGRGKQKTSGNRHMRRSVEWVGVHRVNKMDTTGTFRKVNGKYEGGGFWGGLTGVEKIMVLDGER